MGQGQEVHARRIVGQSMSEGGWVLLQNCHLGLDYMDELLDTITSTESIHQTFRCWITTEVHPKFPINLLQVNLTELDVTRLVRSTVTAGRFF
jgi:dynein heavy chain